MKYAAKLKKLFIGTDLTAEDLLLLESFQIRYLPDRIPRKEFAALLRAYPYIQLFLISKNSTIENFINNIFKEYKASYDKATIERYCDDLVWEIADLIIYNKHPELYDENVDLNWKIEEIISIELLKGKIVADVGAGSGRLSFLLSEYAKTVYAIEPICSFRTHIKEKVKKGAYDNIYTIDGFLDSIPMPDNSIDILVTSNAIGWNLEKELQEIERVVKPGGKAVHLIGSTESESENPFHETFVSADWNYKCIHYPELNGMKLKYIKTIAG